jgi:hypothetical protein
MVAAVWCLAAFVLVTGYNSLLISYVTSPIAEPIIQSIKDLGNTSDIHVVVDAGMGIDYILSVGAVCASILIVSNNMKIEFFSIVNVISRTQRAVFTRKWETSYEAIPTHVALNRRCASILSSQEITLISL